jgi:hypothetical protein
MHKALGSIPALEKEQKEEVGKHGKCLEQRTEPGLQEELNKSYLLLWFLLLRSYYWKNSV